MITKQTPIATMGSCFAVNFKQYLNAQGYTIVQTESGPGTQSGSARFGRVYNSGCLRQIVESAFGLFKPVERWWSYKGVLVDPYRQGIAWPDEETAEVELRAHAIAVREMIDQCSVLICTVGLSEVWRQRQDKAVFYIAPPAQGAYDPEMHEFVVLSVDENVANLERAYSLVKKANPQVQLILTLSPVQMHSTYRDLSYISADTVSKSILRIALDTFCDRHPEVIYFPAFEIVRSLAPQPLYEANRHVHQDVVATIMQCFMRHYGEE